jgi:phage regulator Rha-like protein
VKPNQENRKMRDPKEMAALIRERLSQAEFFDLHEILGTESIDDLLYEAVDDIVEEELPMLEEDNEN